MRASVIHKVAEDSFLGLPLVHPVCLAFINIAGALTVYGSPLGRGAGSCLPNGVVICRTWIPMGHPRTSQWFSVLGEASLTGHPPVNHESSWVLMGLPLVQPDRSPAMSCPRVAHRSPVGKAAGPWIPRRSRVCFTWVSSAFTAAVKHEVLKSLHKKNTH